MSETTNKPDSPEAVAGLLAEFTGPDSLRAAAAKIREKGFTHFDAHSPFPIHGMERSMGIRMTRLPWIVLAAGLAGAAVALLMQGWMNGVDYPLIISGKPYFSLPANIPIAFELVVLFSALAAFGGAILLNRLPELAHPLLSIERFRRVTTDGFFISIEAIDEKFDRSATTQMLQSLGAVAVETWTTRGARPAYPRFLTWSGILLVVLALLPPLMISKARVTKSNAPRLDPVLDMDQQPKYKTQAASSFFSDGRTMRPPVPGTVAKGQLEEDDHLYRGKVDGGWATTFPMPVTKERMDRGQERFRIYCAPCHGLVGEGDGMVSQRAIKRAAEATPAPSDVQWIQPVSLHAQTVRDKAVGEIFDHITHGVRTMPAYGPQIPASDRWAIVLYLRALQRSQNATIDDVRPEQRDQLR